MLLLMLNVKIFDCWEEEFVHRRVVIESFYHVNKIIICNKVGYGILSYENLTTIFFGSI